MHSSEPAAPVLMRLDLRWTLDDGAARGELRAERDVCRQKFVGRTEGRRKRVISNPTHGLACRLARENHDEDRHSRTGALGAARLELSTFGRASLRRFGLELRVLPARAGSSRKAGLVGVVGECGPCSELEPKEDVAGEKASETRRLDELPPFRSDARARSGGGACLLKTGSDALRGGGKTGLFGRATERISDDAGFAKLSV